MVEKCQKSEKAIYTVMGDISREQRVSAGWGWWPRAGPATFGTMTNWFDVLPIVGLKIDFAAVDFGEIQPITPKRIQGDRLSSPPSSMAGRR